MRCWLSRKRQWRQVSRRWVRPWRVQGWELLLKSCWWGRQSYQRLWGIGRIWSISESLRELEASRRSVLLRATLQLLLRLLMKKIPVEHLGELKTLSRQFLPIWKRTSKKRATVCLRVSRGSSTEWTSHYMPYSRCFEWSRQLQLRGSRHRGQSESTSLYWTICTPHLIPRNAWRTQCASNWTWESRRVVEWTASPKRRT